MKTINLSPIHKYHVESIKDGGMGSVYILNKDKNTPLSFEDRIALCSEYIMEESKYIYREKLAAKTIKSPEFNDQFSRELNIWINFTEKGSVPLLKIIKDQNLLFGIMPFYPYNLRDIMRSGNISPIEILLNLKPCIESLKNIHENYNIVHLDIKPENILVELREDKYSFKLSDWGIANLVNTSLSLSSPKEFNSIRTIIGVGTLPYMAPERLLMSKPDAKSDIFSLGIMFYEIIFGSLPYDPNINLDEQLLTALYYKNLMSNLIQLKNTKLRNLIVEMLHPDKNLRTKDYNVILKQLKKIRG